MLPVWTPVALSPSVEAGTSSGTLINGQEYVVWRDNRGVAHIWEDRCPHRGMRLSFGFVRGDHIACLYHGWQYDQTGQCRHIPAHPDLDVPKTIKVATFRTLEAAGMIWHGPDSGAPEQDEIPFAEIGDSTAVHSLFVDCPPDKIADHLRHFAFQGFGEGARGLPLVEMIHPGLWALRFGGDTLYAGVQGMTEKRTGLHLALSGTDADAATRKHYIRYAIALRHHIENHASTGEF
jgi:nitrite reductase/ring-hydroxylating ferredoxin subunit